MAANNKSSDGDLSTPDTDLVRSCNWRGSIPVVLTLAPTSLGTTMMPHPIHLLLNRGTYLHVGLRGAIQRLHKFAPATIKISSGMIIRKEPEPQGGSDNDGDDDHGDDIKIKTNEGSGSNKNSSSNNDTADLPVCWLEDEETQIPLRWHLFSGVLFDMMRATTSVTARQNQSAKAGLVPWKIRLHFSNYPSSQLLPLEPDHVMTTIERSYRNSLKQALFLQYGNSKVAMNMSKEIHQRLWDSVEASNYKLYQQINTDLQASSSNNENNSGGGVQLLPIRLFVDSKPPIQRPCKEKDNENNNTTLGSLLLDWLSDLFQESSNDDDDNEGEVVVTPKSESCRCLVAGITPPMTVSIVDLWSNLCHPDHFLYIVVLTR